MLLILFFLRHARRALPLARLYRRRIIRSSFFFFLGGCFQSTRRGTWLLLNTWLLLLV